MAPMKGKRLPITRKGAALSGGAVAMVVSGFFTAEGIFLLLGASGLVLIALCYVIGKINLAKIHAEIHMPTHVAARRPFEIELTLHNQRFLLDAFNIRIDVILPKNSVFSAVASWTAAGQVSEIILQGIIPNRSHAEIHPTRLSSNFPLGLFRLQRQLKIRRKVVVTPMPIIPLELNNYGSLHDTVPQSGIATGNTFGEPRGVRPWQAGDSARHIHWPASARAMASGHDLRIREYDPPGFHPDQCHIIFHSYASGREMLREDRFERALSLLAGTLINLQEKGIPCVLSADFLDWEPLLCQNRKHLTQCLTILAKALRKSGTESHDLELTLRSSSPDHAIVVLSDMTPDSWHPLLSAHPHALAIDIRQIRYRHRILHAAG